MTFKSAFTFSLSMSLLFAVPANALLEKYHPANTDFWEATEKDMKNAAFDSMINRSTSAQKKIKADSLQASETQLAIGLAVYGYGFTYGATKIFGDIMKKRLGTEVAAQSLSEIEEIARTQPIDEDYVNGELLTDLEFDAIPTNLQDYVNFIQGLFDLGKGFDKWSDSELKKITPDSYWDFKLRYLSALNEVAKDQPDKALEKFTGISVNDLAPDDIKVAATHQQARLIFAKGDFDNAYKIFRKVKLNPREKGIILLERSWAKYYQKDYSKALGLLAALEAPYFDTSRSPEAYILKMIMYKELCHYPAAFQVVKDFNKRFGRSLDAIKNRRDLRKDQSLVNLSVLDQRLEKWVDFLNLIKDERRNLDVHTNWAKNPNLKDLKNIYDSKIEEVRSRLDWLLQSRVRDVADQLLDWQEQLTFLDYQTRLDSLRVLRTGDEDYKSEEVPKLKFDKVYWTNEGEIWLDELEDYKVLIDSRCDKQAPR